MATDTDIRIVDDWLPYLQNLNKQFIVTDEYAARNPNTPNAHISDEAKRVDTLLRTHKLIEPYAINPTYSILTEKAIAIIDEGGYLISVNSNRKSKILTDRALESSITANNSTSETNTNVRRTNVATLGVAALTLLVAGIQLKNNKDDSKQDKELLLQLDSIKQSIRELKYPLDSLQLYHFSDTLKIIQIGNDSAK